MPTKKNLDKLFNNDQQPKKPLIRRGQGLKLSTEEPPPAPTSEIEPEAEPGPVAEIDALTHERISAESHQRTSATSVSLADLPVRHKRVNRGYKLREDLIKACKRIALEEDRKLYEVMEEALAMYLAQRQEANKE
jgi:hypothetical protein